MPGVLYIVATPIGNLGDMSARALEVLRTATAVVCEDTRVTGKLLKHFGIDTPTVAYHHHSPLSATQRLVERLVQGHSLAYVSDAGTPGVSDPGGKLVDAAAEAGVSVVPIPGASAVTAALSVAGFSVQQYLFLGFPPHKKGRQTFFKTVAESMYAVVFYESTHRIAKALTELARLVPERPLVVCRELTKKFETVYRGTADDVLGQLVASSSKGEFVIVVGPA
jgi:16S rRNA (cytidine1402-2'-O)-methyltransferase